MCSTRNQSTTDGGIHVKDFLTLLRLNFHVAPFYRAGARFRSLPPKDATGSSESQRQQVWRTLRSQLGRKKVSPLESATHRGIHAPSENPISRTLLSS
jgi:hypothetical protein